MFSYLRPHRRTPSNPTSPVPEQSHSWDPPLHPVDHAHPSRFQDFEPPTKPSILPPIARVSSMGYETAAEISSKGSRAGVYERDQRAQYGEITKGESRGKDMSTFSNHPRIPIAGTQRPESAVNAAPARQSGFQHSSPQTSLNHDGTSRQQPLEQTATDLQSKLIPGRRPTGARLPTPPPSGSNPVSTFEPIQPRSGKTRLNLLNPMSLLARRRTSQAIPQLSAESLASNRTRNEFYATFDPRIRGTVVHDFSAPRPTRRNVSYNDVRTDGNLSTASTLYQRSPNPQHVDINADDNSNGPWSGGNHTPVFTENFEEEQYPAAGPHVRKASDLSDLPLPKPPYARSAQKPHEHISTSKGNDTSQHQIQATGEISTQKFTSDVGPPVPPKAEGDVPQLRRISIDPAATPPKPASTSKKGRSRNVSEVSTRDVGISGLPKHMKSTSSRFSFDMIGAAEQERLLEDRHRQRALEKKNENAEDQYDDEDDYDYDNMMDDEGLEERIPGVNADAEEDEDIDGLFDDEDDLEEKIPGVNADADENDDGILDDSENVAGFTFQQFSMVSPLSLHSPGLVSTPRDINGEVIGFAMTRDSPPPLPTYITQNLDTSPTTSLNPDSTISEIDKAIQGMGIQGVDTSGRAKVEGQGARSVDAPEFPQASGIDDDDLYFDDGIIDELGVGDEIVAFDESVFDSVDTDQYGRPLKSFSSLPTLYSPPTLTADPSSSFNNMPEIDENNLKSPDVPDSSISPGTLPTQNGIAPKPSLMESTSPPSHGLTQDSLAAYQSALAAAACTAAANGKFRRDSLATEQEGPGLIPDSSQASHYEPFSPSYELEDDFDYDDALEDDPIIAAANAEALANDCEGFYGREFGFYSAPAAGEAEYANGGYFGPRGVEGVNRSQSGRVLSREPNLTPITERSEYSNRNSFMSLSMHGPGSVTSPGLAQLAGMMSERDYEGDMSLNALLKLRRGAWGGSQASLHSSTGSPRSAGGAEDLSPVSGLPQWTPLNHPAEGRHRRQNSNFSIETVSEDESGPPSPTLTMAMVNPKRESQGKEELEKTREMDKGLKNHRYTGSAESISYLKEEDPLSPTGDRWVLERRRTAESGEVEFLGREVVSGGRI